MRDLESGLWEFAAVVVAVVVIDAAADLVVFVLVPIGEFVHDRSDIDICSLPPFFDDLTGVATPDAAGVEFAAAVPSMDRSAKGMEAT